MSDYAKIKNIGQITSETLVRYTTMSENIGYMLVGYTSGYIPPDAPSSASVISQVRINMVSPRHTIEWIDRTFRRTKIKEGDTWTNWY